MLYHVRHPTTAYSPNMHTLSCDFFGQTERLHQARVHAKVSRGCRGNGHGRARALTTAVYHIKTFYTFLFLANPLFSPRQTTTHMDIDQSTTHEIYNRPISSQDDTTRRRSTSRRQANALGKGKNTGTDNNAKFFLLFYFFKLTRDTPRQGKRDGKLSEIYKIQEEKLQANMSNGLLPPSKQKMPGGSSHLYFRRLI